MNPQQSNESPILPPPPLEPQHNFLSKKNILTFFGVLIILFALPVGVYLVLTGTNFLPRASTPTNLQPETVFLLETDKTKSNLGEEFEVTLLARSDLDEANLFVGKLNFSQDVLEIKNIATDSSQLNKWIESSFDNSIGQISLIAGAPNPGIKTNLSDNIEKIKIAKIIFKTKGIGTANINLSDQSQIFRNTDNQPILELKNIKPLTVSILDLGEGSSSSSAFLNSLLDQTTVASRSSEIVKASESAQIAVLSPKAGADYYFLSPLEILWQSSQPLTSVSLALLVNNQYFGEIAGNLADSGSYSWQVSRTLPIITASPKNTFYIQVTGQTRTGEVLTGINGPFGILTKEASGSADLIEGVNLEMADISKILTNFLKDEVLDRKIDLNGDGLVNDLDLWLSRIILLRENLIQN